MTTTFTIGDKVSAEGKVSHVDTFDGELTIEGPDGRNIYAYSSSVKLVEKAVPPVPPIGTFVKYTSAYGSVSRYFVKDSTGVLAFVSSSGDARLALDTWQSLNRLVTKGGKLEALG